MARRHAAVNFIPFLSPEGAADAVTGDFSCVLFDVPAPFLALTRKLYF